LYLLLRDKKFYEENSFRESLRNNACSNFAQKNFFIKGQFHRLTGERRKFAGSQSWMERTLFYFINRISPNSTSAKSLNFSCLIYASDSQLGRNGTHGCREEVSGVPQNLQFSAFFVLLHRLLQKVIKSQVRVPPIFFSHIGCRELIKVGKH
jgi:hypothetical protein